MEGGYIKKWRKIYKHILHPINKKRSWTGYEAMEDLIMMAHGSPEVKRIPKGNQVIEIKRGQLDVTMRQLQQRWRWSAGKLQSFLFHLLSENFLIQNPNRWFTVLTIVNYDEYNPLNERKTNGKRTENERKTNTIKRRIKKVNEGEDIGDEKKISSPPTPSQTMKDFIAMVSHKNERYEKFVEKVSVVKKLSVEIIRMELDKFVSYWTEKTPDGKKQLWQTKKTFEVQRRLGTWFENYFTRNPRNQSSNFVS